MSEWKTIESATKTGMLNLKSSDGYHYGFEWFEGAWCRLTYDQCGNYPLERVVEPTHWCEYHEGNN